MLTILFDGIAYGMLLFLLACGLAVTLGLMNFVNLAHGAFAMAGGYLTAVLSNRLGVPFLACLPLAFRLLRRALGACSSPCSIAASTGGRIWTRYCSPSASCSWRSRPSTIRSVRRSSSCAIPAFLRQRFEMAGVGIGAYRLFIIVVCGALALLECWPLAGEMFTGFVTFSVASALTLRDAAAAPVGEAGVDAWRLQEAAAMPTKRYAAAANLKLCFILEPLRRGQTAAGLKLLERMIYDRKS